MARARFRGGIHPDDHKAATAASAVQRGPLPGSVVIPMSQHLGAPCEPVVAIGDLVVRGQTVGDIRAKVSSPVHSPVSGKVRAIDRALVPGGQRPLAVTIETDPEQDLDTWVPVPENDDPREVVCAAGIVGMGGAAFPTKVKLEPPHDMPVSTVILNGCECEPFLTCDHRAMLEKPERIIGGGRMIRDIVGAERIVIGIEANKADAADALREHAGSDVEILVLPTRYPQGAEKQLIWSVLGKEVPHGKLPAATGALVHNVGTAAAVWEAFELRKPLMERVVTVSGAVGSPGNYLTLVGTSVGALLEYAGGVMVPDARLVAGGPMCGAALGTTDVPIVKGTSGIIALPADTAAPAIDGDQACIRCGRCVDSCPMMLEPYMIGIHSNVHDWDACEDRHALDCIECGCCAYACPTRRPLVPLLRQAKTRLMSRGAKT